ncbi:MAG: YebC/PmpR family DNA-binding transcriptional regulator [bacterium]|nr:YebC/PmpR family DNA-binding transcriptional regulator [bacterium]
MAGHSKWANIKHRKEGADKKRGKIFTKVSKELMVSARLGGADPGSNSRLRIAISKARAANMPKDSIERAIKKGTGELGADTYEEVMYEVYAPGGVGILVDALTDKKTRTTPEIKNIINKNNATLAEANAVSRLFQLRGYINIPADAIGEDELMELALEAGAEDIKSDSDAHEIYTGYEDYAGVAEALAEKEIANNESGVRFMPMEGTEITVADADQAQKIMKLIDQLDDHDDVQNVYTNLDVPDDVLAQME